MISHKYVVSGKQGLHVTDIMNLCRAASDYESGITLKGGRKSADCENVLALMSLDARRGECLELLVEGPDKDQATDFLQGLVRTIL